MAHEPSDDTRDHNESLRSRSNGVHQVLSERSNSLPYRPRINRTFTPISVIVEKPRRDHSTKGDFTDTSRQDEVGYNVDFDDDVWLDWMMYWGNTGPIGAQTSQQTPEATQGFNFADSDNCFPHPNTSISQTNSTPSSLPSLQVLGTFNNPLAAVGEHLVSDLDMTVRDFLETSSQTHTTSSQNGLVINSYAGENSNLTRPDDPMDDSFFVQDPMEQPETSTLLESKKSQSRPGSLSTGGVCSSILGDVRQVHRAHDLEMGDAVVYIDPKPSLREILQDSVDYERIVPHLLIDTQTDGVRRQRSWSCRDVEKVAQLDKMMDERYRSERRQGCPSTPTLRPPEINVPPSGDMQYLRPSNYLTPIVSSADGAFLSPYATPFTPPFASAQFRESSHFYTRSTSHPSNLSTPTMISSNDMSTSPPPSPSPSITSVRSLDSALQCPHCGKEISNTKRFKDRQSNLRRHIRVKHCGGPKPICLVPGCGKTFERSDALAKHRKNHHKL